MRLTKKFSLKLNQAQDLSITPVIKMGIEIPKIVHQTFPTKNLPSELLANINQMKELNPNWDFRLYDDNDIEAFITYEFPSLLAFYKQINPSYGAARADFFRYLLLYKKGGVYLDIKSSLSKTLDEIITPSTRYILSYWSNGFGKHLGINDPNGEFQQWHIISVVGHPFLKAVIENVCQNITTYNPVIHDTGYYGVIKVTGPIAYSRVIESIRERHPYTLGFDSDLGLIYSIYNSSSLTNCNHQSLFKKHYTQLKEPLIKQPFYINWLFWVFPRLSDFRDGLKARIFNS
jgi:inositol phosphorylceramide mannosyltransferase catalytic subunit